ncbi:hypothetical protein CI088_07795 [Enterococcus plantarum]|uniref:DUF4393 domain-containing protein n=1 Tax=Enterococcus plantarum TaxID=1077675 RepID=A0A2W3Z2C2_9ENTE|nr:Abi-alpha family protein [Enterococcus plantarum]PZL74091.1 hypothetical protein CI088_07795 [Enterococcus plantarum]
MSEKKDVTKIELSPISVPEEVVTDLVAPTSKIIGQVLGAALNKVTLKARKYYLASEYDLKEFEKSLTLKLNQIPLSNRTSDNLAIATKTISDSRYSLTKTDVRELFENIIVSTVDSSKSELVHPRFSSIIRELDVNEAKLLKFLKKHRSIDILDFYLSGDDYSVFFSQNIGFHLWLKPNDISNDEHYNLEPITTYQESELISNKIDISISILESFDIIEPTVYYSSEDEYSVEFPWFNPKKIDPLIINKLLKIPEIELFAKKRLSQYPNETTAFEIQQYSLTTLGIELMSIL